jgi:pSer/pThr/pTyr-binding forkhead associated (FHA) protein
MVPAYLLSLLAKQRAALQDRFGEKFPHHWLVWEPGSWTAPKSGNETIQVSPKNIDKLGQGDALSFGLPSGEGKADTLKVGRHNTNDIVLNDATVSRQHAVIRLQQPEWTVEPLPGAKAGTQLSGIELKAGQPVPLRSGNKLKLGEVTLTFYDLPGFLERLKDLKPT